MAKTIFGLLISAEHNGGVTYHSHEIDLSGDNPRVRVSEVDEIFTLEGDFTMRSLRTTQRKLVVLNCPDGDLEPSSAECGKNVDVVGYGDSNRTVLLLVSANGKYFSIKDDEGFVITCDTIRGDDLRINIMEVMEPEAYELDWDGNWTEASNVEIAVGPAVLELLVGGKVVEDVNITCNRDTLMNDKNTVVVVHNDNFDPKAAAEHGRDVEIVGRGSEFFVLLACGSGEDTAELKTHDGDVFALSQLHTSFSAVLRTSVDVMAYTVSGDGKLTTAEAELVIENDSPTLTLDEKKVSVCWKTGARDDMATDGAVVIVISADEETFEESPLHMDDSGESRLIGSSGEPTKTVVFLTFDTEVGLKLDTESGHILSFSNAEDSEAAKLEFRYPAESLDVKTVGDCEQAGDMVEVGIDGDKLSLYLEDIGEEFDFVPNAAEIIAAAKALICVWEDEVCPAPFLIDETVVGDGVIVIATRNDNTAVLLAVNEGSDATASLTDENLRVFELSRLDSDSADVSTKSAFEVVGMTIDDDEVSIVEADVLLGATQVKHDHTPEDIEFAAESSEALGGEGTSAVVLYIEGGSFAAEAIQEGRDGITIIGRNADNDYLVVAVTGTDNVATFADTNGNVVKVVGLGSETPTGEKLES